LNVKEQVRGTDLASQYLWSSLHSLMKSLTLAALYSIFLLADSKAATITAASASFSDVSAAVASAARGDTVRVPAGSATWDGNTLSLTKGINLLGAGRDSTILVGNGVLISIAPDRTAITKEETIRVEGFTFDGNNAALNSIKVFGAGAASTKPFKNLAVANNRFRDMSNQTAGSGVFYIFGQIRGVIFGNIFDRCNVILKIMGNDDTREWSNGHFPQSYGTADNLFFENNTIQYSSTFSGGDPGWIESGQGGRIVVRYNTFNFAHAKCSEYWDIHGFQNWPGNGQTGTMVVEYYGNTLTNTSGYRWIAHRGGWGLFYNNIMAGSNGGAIHAQQYGPNDSGGSGCTADVSHASGHYITEITNTYIFNNTVNGAISNMTQTFKSCAVAENLSFWNYNSSFNGTSGIGCGTGTPSGNCTIGVAYWKASPPTPTTDPNVVQNGTLYKCLSTNVWTAYYTPYTYPHPLRNSQVPAPGNLPIIP
jgi:hypothetical protein